MRSPLALTLMSCIVVALSGCASGLSVHRFSDMKIDSSDKQLVLLGDGKWSTELRVELAKHGFKIKKFASTQSTRSSAIAVTKTGLIEEERASNQAEARYALTLTQKSVVDWCPFNDNIKANFSLEVADLKTNEVVLVIEKGNWTGICGPFSIRSKYIFEEMSDELAENWR